MLNFRTTFQKRAAISAQGIHNTPQIGTINNLVIFIRFSDESESSRQIGAYDTLFNSGADGINSMYNYYREVSYNQLSISSHFYPNPSDPYSATFSADVGRTSIDDTTNPSSFLTGGSAGGLKIYSIGVVGGTMSFTLGNPGNLRTSVQVQPQNTGASSGTPSLPASGRPPAMLSPVNAGLQTGVGTSAGPDSRNKLAAFGDSRSSFDLRERLRG
jgi:hypothetical protein